jgi:hypothetical protein
MPQWRFFCGGGWLLGIDTDDGIAIGPQAAKEDIRAQSGHWAFCASQTRLFNASYTAFGNFSILIKIKDN